MKTKFRLATFILLLPIIAVYYYHQAKVAAPLYPSGIALVDEDRFLIFNRGEKTIALYSLRSDKPILKQLKGNAYLKGSNAIVATREVTIPI